MNKKALVCIASFPLFAIGTLFATTTGEADWLIPNGGEGWPVVFEDNNLNQREKKQFSRTISPFANSSPPQAVMMP